MNQVGNFGDSSNEQLRQKVEALPLPSYFETRNLDPELQACQRYFERIKMGGEHLTKAWGHGLEDSGDSKLVVGRVVPSAVTTYPSVNSSLPQTLGEAFNLKTAKHTVPATEATMDLTVAKLVDIKNLTQQHYTKLLTFERKDQGLAMNMLAEIMSGIEDVINSLENDINK